VCQLVINNGQKKVNKRKKFKPIAVVASKPLNADEQSGQSEGWLLYVDFAGIEIPKLRVRGGVMRESGLNVSPTVYSGKYPFVTRVEYFFKHGPVFDNSFRNMCRFKTKITKRIEKDNARAENKKKKGFSPISVSDKPIDQNGKFWKVSVRYDGDWEFYFPKIKERFEYNPFGAKIDKIIYNQTENVTMIEYRFRRGALKRGELRAWDFIDRIKSQITTTKQNENIK
jgi:hypothetical protein